MIELKPGERFGDYVLDSLIGQGGLSEVWCASPIDGGRAVALKILHDPDRSPAHRGRFLREGRLLQAYPHGGLPRCHGWFEGPSPHLVLELLAGITLSERLLAVGALPAGEVEAIAMSLLQVLDHLHRHGVMHRDLKPPNVWLGEDRRVMVLDLGLAVDPSDALHTTLGDVMGTYAYMSPEQIAGGELDPRADLYSLGVTLYEALAGARPYLASSPAEYLAAHRDARCAAIHELCPEAPERLLDLIARLMARDPASRPATAPIARALLTGETAPIGQLQPAPLLGRAAALGAMEALLDAGRGSLALEGPLGSGLGSLSQMVATEARARGYHAITLRCRVMSPAQGPLEQLRRDLMADYAPAMPEGLARALEAWRGEGPLLVILEDWDEAALPVRRALEDTLARLPTLAVVRTGRSGIPGDHRLLLRPLTLDEAATLISAMLGNATPPAGLVEDLHDATDGQPAALVLAMREMAAAGVLWSEGMGEDGVPLWRVSRRHRGRGLARLLTALVESLSPSAAAALSVLAVLGEPVRLAHLAPLVGGRVTEASVGELRQIDVVVEREDDEGPSLELRRAALGRFLVDRVEEGERRRIHRDYAALLEEAGAPKDRISWHVAHGADPREAQQRLLELGRGLHERGRDVDALSVYDLAGRAASAEPTLAAELAVARGAALEALGRRPEAIAALSAGLHLARDLGHRELEAAALVSTASTWHAVGNATETARLAAEARALLGASHPLLSMALFFAAEAERWAGRPGEAADLLAQCIEQAMLTGHRLASARATGALGRLAFEDGETNAALSNLRREASWHRRRRRLGLLVPVLVEESGVLRCQGRIRESLAVLDEAEEHLRFAEAPYLLALTRLGRCATLASAGDMGGATGLLKRARVALEPEAPMGLRLFYRELQGQLRLARRDTPAALTAFQAAEREARTSGQLARAAYFQGMLGVLTADGGALTEAMTVLGSGGERRLAARLLLLGAQSGRDTEILASAEAEARDAGDRFLLLEVLRASGRASALDEATEQVQELLRHIPDDLTDAFLSAPTVRWTGARSRLRLAARGVGQDRPFDRSWRRR